jgi:endonuclease-3
MKSKDVMKASDNKTREKKIVSLLRREYPSIRTALEYRTPLQLLISTILSAQCTDKRVNEVTKTLFKKYRGAEDFANASQEEFEKEIRSTGFFRNKAKNIIAASKRICGAYKGKVPDSMDELLTLPGVARKTANIVLSSAFKKAEGIAVDVHVKRLSNRLGLSKKTDPVKIEKDLMEIVPVKDWIDFNYLLVDHGRKICIARKPLCPECVLKKLCPAASF